jgi:hypothetical protein
VEKQQVDVGIYVIIGVLWILSPLLGLWIGRSKGRPDAIGCLAGILLGPLVLLMLGISALKTCPFCKTRGLDVDAVACKKCGRDLAPATPPQA